MKTKNKISKAKAWTRGVLPLCLTACLTLFTSCADFFEQDSNMVVFADKDHLNDATDSIYSVIGILNKLQAVADRTVLLGEARADLVDVTAAANADLRDVAMSNIGDDNKYNRPRDYYAVINNCNYFIKNVEDSLKNNRNEYIFLREVAAVKAVRAWTYLQLALNYGSVPFYTEPLLTKEESEREYPRVDLKYICDYFIKDLLPYTEQPLPGYGTIKSLDSRFFFFPINVLLGELYLWRGNDRNDYKNAAICYYNYIVNRNGTNSTYPTGTRFIQWNTAYSNWRNIFVDLQYEWISNSESWSSGELITMIPGDSIKSEGNYSELRGIFNTTVDNDYKASLTPSKSMTDLSAAQTYCHLYANGSNVDTLYAPSTLTDYQAGDLRLWGMWRMNDNSVNSTTGDRYTSQTVFKYSTRNVHLYRRTMLWLHMAEAMNAAGYPRFAYAILSKGLNNRVIEEDIIPYYRADSTFLRQFDFPASRYVLYNTPSVLSTANTQGIHSRGSGFSQYNKDDRLPDDAAIEDSLARIAYQQKGVEKMIIDEGALEFVFEGLRWYELMRFALRNNDPAILADRVYARRGAENSGAMRGEIAVDLTNPANWYMSWKGKIGMK